MTTPQQQPEEERVNKSLDNALDFMEGRKSYAPATQHPQKQWMEEARTKLMKVAVADVDVRGGQWLVAVDDALTICQSQLEAAKREEREQWFVSWDIADGGKDWCVLIGHKTKDGTTEILARLDKDSDDGGNFNLASLTNHN